MRSKPINMDAYDVDEDHSIVDRFEAVVDTYCNAIALDSAGQKTTYSELDRIANHISRYVLDNSLDAGPVALLFQANLLSVASIFGVLKTGRMFVFLNPSFPPDRLASVIESVKPVLILTEEKYLGMLSSLCQLPVQDVSAFEFSSDINRPRIQVSPDAPAYIIYTSGSTGVPKGVVFTHRMVLHDIKYVIKDADISPTDRFGMLTALSFVASRAGLYGALLAGATLCMHDLSNSDAGTIAAWLDEAQISILYTTPSLFRSIFSAVPDAHIFRFIRTVHLAGEKVTPSEVELFRSHCRQDGTLIIVYGQTETGRVARFCVRHDTNWNDMILPVGYPLPGKEVIIIGADGEMARPGEIGDIVVRSSYIPSGYFGNADLAGPGFVQDVHDHRFHFFHTGDIGKRTEDGLLVYFGRKDSQVKINGQRVELGDVEAALLRQGDVQSALVVARPVGNDVGRIKLIAYVVQKLGNRLTANDLREHLLHFLPAYMVPSRFIFIPSMPLSVHGKVDMRLLPDPENRQALSEADMPVDEIEERLLVVWKHVFNLEKIGVNDNFFELGGDSLMAMGLLIQIEKSFSIRMPLAVISKATNIRQQAEILRSGGLDGYASPLISIRASGKMSPVFCIGGVGGNPIRFQRLVHYLKDDCPVYFFRSRGFKLGEDVKITIEEIAMDYLREIEKLQVNGPYCFVGESGGGLVAYEMAQQLHRQGRGLPYVWMLDTHLSVSKYRSSSWRYYFRLFKKHIQTLVSGGRTGLWAYLQYYAGLLKLKIDEVRYESRKKKVLGQDKDILDVYEAVKKANKDAIRAYKPQAYPGRVVLFSAMRQIRLDGSLLDHGWGNVGVGELIIHPVDCFHGNILFEPFVQQVAEKINQYWD